MMPMTGYMDAVRHRNAMIMVTSAKTIGMDVGDKVSTDHAEQRTLTVNVFSPLFPLVNGVRL